MTDELQTYARIILILGEGEVSAYHYRCGGDVRIHLERGSNLIFCDACNASGRPVPRVDDNGSIVVIQNAVQVCLH